MSQELHGFNPQGQAFAVFALIHVEAGQLFDAVEAVADGVAVGEEVGGRLGRRGVVAKVLQAPLA